MTNRIFLSLLLIVCFYITSIGQMELKILSPKKMKKDLNTLLETIDAHPDPYAKISKKEFQKIIQNVEQNISEELDEIEYYKNISKIVASIGDGHSSVNMPKYWLKKARKKNGAFPYEVFLSNEDELFVIKTYGDTLLALGAQILEINGMSIDAFVETVTPYISYETIPFRNDKISRNFELMLYLVFKKVDPLNFKFKVSKESEVIIPTIPYKEWKKQKKDLREEREKKIARGKPYDFNIIKPGIAKIDIFSFGVRTIDKYNIFLSDTFKKIKKNEVHSLIIDVRGNYGGWPKIASELFHYIHEGHFKTMAKSSMKISYPYRNSFTDRYPQLRSANISSNERRHFINLREVIRGKVGSYVEEDRYFNEAPITEMHEFKGDCYLLIDRKSFSASSSFASTFQCYSMGIIIGEPTGGTKIFRANAFTKTLSKSRLVVRMSTTKLFSACYNQENEPVIPNIEVVPTIVERVHNSDSQLNTTLRLIKKMQQKKAENK